MKFQFLPVALVLALAAITCPSCDKGLESSGLSIYLTDAPASYDAVNIEIRRIDISTADDYGDESWQVFRFANPGTYNLLDYSNGLDTLLSTAELKPGRINQLRLVLGTQNSVVIDGVSYPLALTPSSLFQTGLKINVNASLAAGEDYKLWIDFDAAQSIVETGTGGYQLKPVLRSFMEGNTGGIRGNVQPAEAEATVYAIAGSDTIATIPFSGSGDFMIRGLLPGTWKILAHGHNGYQDEIIGQVAVQRGMVTVLDSIRLVP